MADRIIEKINEGVRLIKNNLNKDDLNILLNYAKNADENLWNKNNDDNDFWNGRYIHYADVTDDEVKKVMISLMARINKAIRLEYNTDNQVYSDLLQFVRWPVGVELRPHCDQEEPDGSPHPFPFRDWASITYLNVEEFEGGEIYYTSPIDLTPKLESGMTAIHRGTCKYMHGVHPVTKGVRYTIATFWNTEKRFESHEINVETQKLLNKEFTIEAERGVVGCPIDNKIPSPHMPDDTITTEAERRAITTEAERDMVGCPMHANTNGIKVKKEYTKINDMDNRIPDDTIAVITEHDEYNKDYVDSIVESLRGNIKRDWFIPHTYQCPPLTLANQMGFLIKSISDFRVKWTGGYEMEDVIVENDNPTDNQFVVTHFGMGVFTIQNRFTFRTPPGVNLMLINPPNMFKDGIHQMTTILETDNLRRDFTYNMRITRPNIWIEFKVGDPIGCIIPTPRGFIDGFNVKMGEDIFDKKMIDNERDIMQEFGEERRTSDPHKPKGNGRRYYKGEDVRDNKFIWGHQPGSSIKKKQYKMIPPKEILEKKK